MIKANIGLRLHDAKPGTLAERSASAASQGFECAHLALSKLMGAQYMDPAVFLASHASDAVNGHILYVDGGILAYIGKQPK